MHRDESGYNFTGVYAWELGLFYLRVLNAADTSSIRWHMKSVINSAMLISHLLMDYRELLTNPGGVRYNKIGCSRRLNHYVNMIHKPLS